MIDIDAFCVKNSVQSVTVEQFPIMPKFLVGVLGLPGDVAGCSIPLFQGWTV